MNNNDLFEYGIQNEGSNLRAHVCVNAGVVYVFPTHAAVTLLDNSDRKYRRVYGYQPGIDIATAEGYLVPPSDIPNCVLLNTHQLIERHNFAESDSTTEKGEKAVQVVMSMIRRGWFSLPVMPTEVNDFDLQRAGLDIVVKGQWRIQVKCDFTGGDPSQSFPRITGHLFLQIAERNPLNRH